MRVRDWPKPRPVLERLRTGSRIDPTTGCWLWQKARNVKGYGRINVRGVIKLAHRAAYEEVHGPLPAGVSVLHRCDTPPCCNVEHVYAGSAAQNTADMVERGRDCSGERAPYAKLTDAAVTALLDAYRGGEKTRVIAARFGVTHAMVSRIVAGKAWKHLHHLAPPLRRPGGTRRHARVLAHGSK